MIFPVVLLSSLSAQLFFFLFFFIKLILSDYDDSKYFLKSCWIFITAWFCLIQLCLCFWGFFSPFLSGLVNQMLLSSYSHFSVLLAYISFLLSVTSIDFLLQFTPLQDPKWHWPSLLPSGCLIHTQPLHRVPLCPWMEQKTLCEGKRGRGNCTIYPNKYAAPTRASQNWVRKNTQEEMQTQRKQKRSGNAFVSTCKQPCKCVSFTEIRAHSLISVRVRCVGLQFV